MLLKLLLQKLRRRLSLDDSSCKRRYMVECVLYNLYAVIWLAFTIYVWISWHKQGITFKVIATIIDIFAIPTGLTDTWSFKRWMAEKEKQKK